MKKKKIAGKILSIILSAALVFSSVELPVSAAEGVEATRFEEAGELETADDTSYIEETSDADAESAETDDDTQAGLVDGGQTGEETENDAATGEQAAGASESVIGEQAGEETENDAATGEQAADASESVIGEQADGETESVLGEQTDGETEAVTPEESFEGALLTEAEGLLEESVSGDVIAEEEEALVLADATAGVTVGPYIVYGGEKNVDFTYKTDDTTKVNTLKVITTTPLIIESKSGKASAPIVLGNASSPCEIHVTLRNVTSISTASNQNVAAISIPADYTKDVYLAVEGSIKLTSGAGCAGIQKNITSTGFSKAGTLYLSGSATLTVTGGEGGAGIGSGVMSDLDTKVTPMTGKIVIEGITVTTTGKGGGAGIGGGTGSAAKDIEIVSGEVTAVGKSGGAGIGGGAGGSGSYLTVKGGTVTATASDAAAGIGGGSSGEGSNISVYAGKVTATGKAGGAGIGGGSGKAGKDISIYGGTYIKAVGGANAAGIGGGNKGAGSNLTIYGGDEILAEGGSNGAGIGGGSGKDGKSITISGGKVTATSTKGGAAIGGGKSGKGTGIVITNGTVVAYALKEKKSDSVGAGIGGGAGGDGDGITIQGGTVDARSDDGAGIGGGKAGEGTNITITEGNIYAYGGADAAGIGSGKGENASNIKIQGGTVVAENDSTAADHYTLGAGYGGTSSNIYISGGSVNASVDPDCTVTKDETSKEAVTKQVFGGYTAGSRISLTGITYADYYNAANLTADSQGQVYLWLPESADVNAGQYTASVKVSFVTNCYTSEPSQYVASGGKITLPETKDYVVEQAEFAGWYTSADFAESTKWTEDSNVSADTVLYAKWKHYYIVYYYNAVSKKYYGTENVYDGNKAKGIADPERSGFAFTGWYDQSTGDLFDFTSVITQNVTVYAGWDRNALAPIASVSSGEVKEDTVLWLRTNTTGGTIYYTTDGSVPTAESTKYTDPITLTSSMLVNGKIVIRTFTVKDGLRDSGIVRYTYTISDAAKDAGEVLEQDYPNGDISQIPTEGIWIGGLKAGGYTYTGKAIKPDIRIYDGKKLLVEKKDYTISFKNNVNVNGTKKPVIQIIGKGNYAGKLDPAEFTISPADISKDTEEDTFEADDISVVANGKVQNPSVVVTRNGKKLKKNKDYTVDYSAVQASAGVYTLKITGIGNYTGTREVKLTVTDKTLMSKVSVSKVAAQSYTGSAIEPSVTVTYKGSTLVKGTDYTVEYRNNVSAGTGKILIKAVSGSGFGGTKTVSFKITGTSMSKVKASGITSVVTYQNGSVTLSGYQLYTTDGKSLTENQDYVVSYEKNTGVGTAKIVFTGIGGYSGTLKANFKIAAYNLAHDEKKLLTVQYADSVEYQKGGAENSPVVTFGGEILTEGKDYTVSYKNNNAVSDNAVSGNKTAAQPTIVITGKGNFTGTITQTYKITQAALSNVSFTVADRAFSETPGNHLVTPVLVDVNGKTLTAGKDYDTSSIQYTYYENVTLVNGTTKVAGSLVEKTDIIPAGTEIMIRVPATENGNYTGAVTAKYRIIKKNINSVSFTVQNKEYTGDEILPGKTDIYSKTVSSADYEIIGYSNNVEKGTATVTIRGVGNYGGTKQLNFKIGAKQMIWFVPKTTTEAKQ